MVVGCWELYVLVTAKVISGQVPTCGSARSRQFSNTAPLGETRSPASRPRYPT